LDDPYKTLGVSHDASEADIRRAYRKLAKQHHPDLNPGNASAEERFKAVSAANELLSDAEKRGQFDRGEIDASGQERAQRPNYREYADADTDRYGRSGAPSGGWNSDDFGEIFGSMFGSGQRGGSEGSWRGHDEHYSLTTRFLDAVNGATQRLTLPDGRTLDVKIPPGTSEGQVLRLRGQGGGGTNGAPAGDALIEIHVAAHRYFKRDGQSIRLELPVTLPEAVIGGPVEVPTPKGPVRMKIPPHSDSGTELRLRGRGMPSSAGNAAGDLFVTLKVMVGPPDAALDAFLAAWKPEPPSNLRRAMEADT
jgi:DnaJ-class molecular chaperone